MSALKAAKYTGPTTHADVKFMSALAFLLLGNLMATSGHGQVTKIAVTGMVMMLVGLYGLGVLIWRALTSPRRVRPNARYHVLLGVVFFLPAAVLIARGDTAMFWLPGHRGAIFAALASVALIIMATVNFARAMELAHPEEAE